MNGKNMRSDSLFYGAVLALSTITVPMEAAESYIVVDQESGYILAAKEANMQRQVASLTKIASAVVILEWLESSQGGFEQLAPVTEDALTGGSNPLKLRSGDKISFQEGLFAAMMASDNSSIYALAAEAGVQMQPRVPRSAAMEIFVPKMNALAARLGMNDTHFLNPHGIDSEKVRGYSTAADMAKLTMYAYDLPGFPELSREKERAITFFRNGDPVTVSITSTNELVGSRGIDGTKTGTTQRAGECLIASKTGSLESVGASRTGRLISVVLQSEDRFRETVLLFDAAWTKYEEWIRAGSVAGPNDCLHKIVK
jgi:D-alanyl-D-alanine carboxypeptidase (penicillin-binding protein 5/6)